MSEEAGDVFGSQGVIEDGATDRLLQNAQQHQLLIDLRRATETLRSGDCSRFVAVTMTMTSNTYLDYGLRDEGVEVRHQFAVDVGHVEVLCDHSDEAHRPVTDPQVRVTQERSCRQTESTNLYVKKCNVIKYKTTLK